MTIAIFDCDGVLVDSSHRYRNLPCGSIDLEYWRENSTPEMIARDRLLPMSRLYRTMLADSRYMVIIATARQCGPADFAYFRDVLGMPHNLIFRHANDTSADWKLKYRELREIITPERRALMFEDNALTIAKLRRRMPHVRYHYVESKQGIKHGQA